MALTYPFNTITTGQTDADSPLNAVLFDSIRENLIHNYEYIGGKDYTPTDNHDHDDANSKAVATVAANAIGQAQMQNNAIGVNELKDALQQTSSGSDVNVVFTGGAYSLGWAMSGSAVTVDGHSTAAYTWGRRMNVTGFTGYFQTRYFQASPPYDMGHGRIPLFIFGIVDNATGEIIAVDIAPDPPWANNGPTNIRPDFTVKATGQKYKYIPKTTLDILGDVADVGKRAAMIAQLKNPQYDVVEVTPEFKNSDMDIVPHPFIGTDLTGKTVVLLDPTGITTEELFFMHDKGENLPDIVRQYIKVGNTDNGSNKPAGILPVSANWK